MFDNFPSYLARKAVICSMLVPPTHQHFVTSPVKLDKPKSFFDCLKSPLQHNWIAAAKIMFEKNKNVAVFSLPFPANELPAYVPKVLRTLLVSEWKATDLKNVWEPRIRECVVGTSQQKHIDFEISYAPSVDPVTVKSHVAYTAATNSYLLIYDITNAFQNCFAKPGNEIYVTVPPCYLEWLKENEEFKYDKNQKYYRQMFNANQCTKDASAQWNNLLTSVLSDYGLTPSKVDHGFFWKKLEDGMMLLLLATDDCLVSVPNYKYAEDFKVFLQQFFELTLQ